MDSNEHDQRQMTTGSGGLPVQHSRPSPTPQEALRPATADDFQRELTACLVLCAASGMSDHDRKEWLITARATLTGIPADLLARGARVARTYCDHPSKIVPQIMREIEAPWEARRQVVRAERSRAAQSPSGDAIPIADLVTPAQIEEIKAEFGIVTNPYPESKKPVGVMPRMPTRADYIAMGVDPSVLAALPKRDEAA